MRRLSEQFSYSKLHKEGENDLKFYYTCLVINRLITLQIGELYNNIMM